MLRSIPNIKFYLDIESQQKEDYRKRFQWNFLPVDIIVALINVFDWWSYGEDLHWCGIIFILAACMFGIDALLLQWLISYKSTRCPRWLYRINIISNVHTLIPYSIGRVIIFMGIDVAHDAPVWLRIISATIYCLAFPMQCLKLYIMWKYSMYCRGTRCCSSQNEKEEKLLNELHLAGEGAEDVDKDINDEK